MNDFKDEKLNNNPQIPARDYSMCDSGKNRAGESAGIYAFNSTKKSGKSKPACIENSDSNYGRDANFDNLNDFESANPQYSSMEKSDYSMSQIAVIKDKKPLPTFVVYGIFALGLIVAFFGGIAVKNYVLMPVEIKQTSMSDTLCDGDLVYIYKFAEINQFDIVVIDDPVASKNWIIKRVVATGGQTVEIRDGILFITKNGETTAYREEYVFGDNITQAPITVPEGYVYVLGDNREVSHDSSEYGCLSARSIIGKAIFVNSESAVEIEID